MKKVLVVFILLALGGCASIAKAEQGEGVGYASASVGTKKHLSFGYRLVSETAPFLALDKFDGIEGILFTRSSSNPIFVPSITTGVSDWLDHSFALTGRLGYVGSTGFTGGMDLAIAVHESEFHMGKANGYGVTRTSVKISATLFQKQVDSAKTVFGIGLEQSF